MYEKLDMTQRCEPRDQKANCILGCIKSSLVSRYRERSSGALSTGMISTCWSRYRGGPQK